MGGFVVRIIKGLLCFGAALSLGLPAEAARVTPMSVELAPTGRESSARIEVTNTEERELPMEVRMYRGIISEAGELELEPADERFVVFPPQVVIEPNTQQIFRVQYLPDEPLSQSEIYYAAISQIPVALDPAVSMIQVVMRFNVLVNVVPDGATAEPVVSWARPATLQSQISDEIRAQSASIETTPAEDGSAISAEDSTDDASATVIEESDEQTVTESAAEIVGTDENSENSVLTSVATAPDTEAIEQSSAEDARPAIEQGFEVRIENQGNRFFAAGRSEWTVTATDIDGQEYSKSYTPSEIGGEIGMGVVPPGGARIFFVPTERPLMEGTITVLLGS